MELRPIIELAVVTKDQRASKIKFIELPRADHAEWDFDNITAALLVEVARGYIGITSTHAELVLNYRMHRSTGYHHPQPLFHYDQVNALVCVPCRDLSLNSRSHRQPGKKEVNSGDFDEVESVVKDARKAKCGLRLQLVAQVRRRVEPEAGVSRKRTRSDSDSSSGSNGGSQSSSGSSSVGTSDDDEDVLKSDGGDSSSDEKGEEVSKKQQKTTQQKQSSGSSSKDTSSEKGESKSARVSKNGGKWRDIPKNTKTSKGKEEEEEEQEGSKKKKKKKGKEKMTYDEVTVLVRIGLHVKDGTEDTEVQDEFASGTCKDEASFTSSDFGDEHDEDIDIRTMGLVRLHSCAWQALRVKGYKAESMLYIAPVKVFVQKHSCAPSMRAIHTVLPPQH